MKIRIGYQPEYVEEEIEMDSEEIVCAVREHLTKEPKDGHIFARLLTDYHNFLEATPDEVLKVLSPQARKITVDTLRKQADRIAAIQA